MVNEPFQSAIVLPPGSHGRALTFRLTPGADPKPGLLRLREAARAWPAAIGVGAPLVAALGASIEGLRPFPALAGPGVALPSTQGALWVFATSDDRSDGFRHGRGAVAALGDAYALDEEVDLFKHDDGRDLTGYEDGTENPKGDAAIEAAFVRGRGAGLDGSSFVAAQRYQHDLRAFDAMTRKAQDAAIGRDRDSNEELAGAPASAHVKRAAQESFDPPAFMLRRSMPWGGAIEHGLYFVAYGESLDRFERVLRRMIGLDDGIVDGLFRFTRALSGGYYWCPPVAGGALDLRALGL